MHKLILAAGAAAVAAIIAGVALAAGGSDLLKDEQHFYTQSQKTFDGGNKGGSFWNMMAVGHNDLGGRGFNGDVWTHKGYAYVGHWGFQDPANGHSDYCPSPPLSGVAVLDARDPSTPTRISTLQNPVGTSAEDVTVFTAKYGPLAGHEIAASGIQWCGGPRHDPAAIHGLMLWDVTNPAAPVELGFYNSGCCTRGVHEFEVQDRPDLKKTFAYVTVPAGNYPDAENASGVRDARGLGDFRLIDITDPRAPTMASSWGIQYIGGPFYGGQGCDPDANYGHGAEPSADGKLVFVSYWDSGFVALDVSNPAKPIYKGRTSYRSNEDGDAHSSNYDEGRKLLFSADEDFCKTSGSGIEKGFGYMRVWDYSRLGAPVEIGQYRTPNSLGTNDQAAGDYVIHNPLLVGTDVYASWYSDGIRIIDTSNPRNPREVAYFVPPAAQQVVHPNQRGTLTNTTQVWGVEVDEATGLIYASDMNSGLWILKRTDR
ncbi:MAG: hypothetical protein ABI948_11550 [Thermoleophilia bacterium]